MATMPCSLSPYDCSGNMLCLGDAMRGCNPIAMANASCTALSAASCMVIGVPKGTCVASCLEGFHLEQNAGSGGLNCVFTTAEYRTNSTLFMYVMGAFFLVYVIALGARLSGADDGEHWLPSMLERNSFGAACLNILSRFRLKLLSYRCPLQSSETLIESSATECAICLDKWTGESDEWVRSLPCPGSGPHGHCFHGECIDRWLLFSSRCPLCNADCNTLMDMTPLLSGFSSSEDPAVPSLLRV